MGSTNPKLEQRLSILRKPGKKGIITRPDLKALEAKYVETTSQWDHRWYSFKDARGWTWVQEGSKPTTT